MKSVISTAKCRDDDELFKTLSEELAVGVCIMQDGKFCYVSNTFPIAIGYTVDELVGKDSLEIVVPEDREMVKENTIKMLKGELRSPYQFRVTCKDGSIVWVMGTVKSIKYHGKRATLGNYMEIRERKLMEEAVEESEERYKELANSITDVFFAMDEHLRYTYWNKASEILTGVRMEDAIGKSIQEVFPDRPWRRKAQEMYRKVLRTQQPQTFVNDYDVDGRHYILEVSSYPSRGGISVFVRDITERKQTEEELQESQERYRALFDRSLDSVYVHDFEGNFLDANETALKSFGYERKDLPALNFASLLSQDQLPRALATLQELKDTGTQKQVSEFRVKRKDGSFMDVETIAAVIYHNGKPYAIQGIGRNVTESNQVREALERSEERYRTLAENAGEAIFVVQDDVVKFINAKGIELSGHSGEQLASRPFAKFIYPDDIPMVADRYLKRLRGELVPQTYDFRIIRKDGDIRWGELNAVPISWQDRPAVLCFMSDITERKQAAERLRQSEERYRTILEQMEDAYFEVDLGGHLAFVNNSVCRDLGYSREELMGKNYKDFTAEEDIESLFRVFNEVYRTGVPNKGFPWKTTRKDGSHGFAETSVSLLKNEQGETIGFRGVGRDITERKRAEEKVRQSEEQYRALFETSGTGMIVLDAETTKVAMLNRAAANIFGLRSAEEAIGVDPLDFIPAEGKDIALQLIKQGLAQDLRQTYELRAVSKAGKEIWISGTAAKITHDGRLARLISFTDITEQKKQTELLMMTDRLASIGELAAGAAHELNNPLASVIGLSELLMERDTPDYIRKDLAMIRSEAQRAANVTSNLLTFARKHRPVKRPTQINDVIEDVLKLRAYAHKSNSIEIERHIAPDLPEIPIDRFQMQQVFLNIVINSEYFMIQAHNRGTLTITTKTQNGSVGVSFADDGPGIPPENLKRIFDPFFTTKEAGKGTGLGLSICHGIVAAHGGQIYATTQSDKGATIFIELPINGSNHVEVML
jgi:two-component system NtrC family sensor kinase